MGHRKGVKKTHWKWCEACRTYYKGRLCKHTRKALYKQATAIREEEERDKLIY